MSDQNKNKLKTPGYFIKRLKDKEALIIVNKIYTINKLLQANDGGDTKVTVSRRY